MPQTQVTAAQIKDGDLTDADFAAANKDGAAATPCLRTLGTGAQQAAPGDDSRLTRDDRLSALVSSEVSVTGTTTLTSSAFGKLHACAGSSAYTITLPATADGANKFVGFRFAATSDAVVTIQRAGSDVIVGKEGGSSATTAKYVADEWVVLYSNGSGKWFIADEWLVKPTFLVESSGTQALNPSEDTKIQFATETDDSFGWFDNATNHRFTPKAPGKYLLFCKVMIFALGSGKYNDTWFLKNSSTTLARLRVIAPGANSDISNFLTVITEMNGSTDYVEVYARHDDDPNSRNANISLFGGYRIRRT